jgi:ABC-type glycerol-3-phosphate transport system permease component
MTTVEDSGVAAPQPAKVLHGRRQRYRVEGSRAGRVLRTVALTLFVIAALFPFYWIVITSLKSDSALAAGTKSLFPSHVTFSAYSQDFTENDFWRPLLNSALIGLITTLVTVLVGSCAGYALARTQIRPKGLFLGFILVAGFFPVVAMVGPLFLAYSNLGLLDNFTSLIVAYLVYTLPIATWFLANFFSQLPVEIEEAAMIDGLGRFRTLYRVVMPVALPGVLTAAILSFILSWNDFIFALSFLQTPSKFTAPLAMVNLGQSQFQVFPNLVDAAVVVVTIPIAAIVIFAQRRIVSGFTAGSSR